MTYNIGIMIPTTGKRNQALMWNIVHLLKFINFPFTIYIYNDFGEPVNPRLIPVLKEEERDDVNIVVINDNKEVNNKPIGSCGARRYLFKLLKSKHDIVVSLDDDMQIVDGWLEAIIEAINDHPDYSVFTGIMKDNDNQIVTAGNKMTVRNGQLIRKKIGTINGKYHHADWGPIGCLVLCRKALSPDIDFPEGLYTLDDAALYLEMKKKSINQTIVATSAECIHRPFSVSDSDMRTSSILRNAQNFFIQNYGIKLRDVEKILNNKRSDLMNDLPIVISGLPRSGTSWAAEVLSKAPNLFYIFEPDNEHLYLKSYILKSELHRYPYLNANSNAPLYHKLWKDILGGNTDVHVFPKGGNYNIYEMEKSLNKKSSEAMNPFFRTHKPNLKNRIVTKNIDFPQNKLNGRLLVKSVYNLLALDWLDHNFEFLPVIIIRHPANIVSSYLNLKFPDSSRNIFSQSNLVEDFFKDKMVDIKKASSIVGKITAQIGGAYYVLKKQLENHPDWILIRHEDLCEDPINQFKKLFHKLDLKFTNEVQNFIINSTNQEGKGFNTNRISQNEIDKYKKLLSKEQMEQIKHVYRIFDNPFDYEI